MSIRVIEDELKSALAAAVDPSWPIRWPSDPWPANINLSNGNLPITADGLPLPCVEVENISGQPWVAIGPKGTRVAMRRGVMRVHLIYPQNIGTLELVEQSDNVEQAFTQADIQVDLANSQRLTTENPGTVGNLGVVEDGNRAVRTITVPWRFFFRT